MHRTKHHVELTFSSVENLKKQQKRQLSEQIPYGKPDYRYARASHGKRRIPASKLAQEDNKITERRKMNNDEKIVNSSNENAINILINKVNLTNI